jgi:GH24 family phage-related lysozyme (muramidase)
MARGIPIPYEQLPKTATNLGGFQKSAGIEGLSTDNSASIRAAGAVAQVDPRGFIVAEQQVGAIGQAIAGEGAAITNLLIERNKSINHLKELDAAEAMELEEQAIAADIAVEPDTTKWIGIAEGRMKLLNESLLKQDLSPDARMAISTRLERWSKRQATATQISSASKVFELESEKMEGALIRAFDKGDMATALGIGQNMRDTGRWSESKLATIEGKMKDRAEYNIKKAKADAFDAAEDTAIKAATEGGEEATIKALDSGAFGTHSPSNLERLRSAIKQTSNGRASEVIDDVANGIVGNVYSTDEHIDAYESVHFTPALRQKAKDMLKNRNAQAEALDRETNGVRNAVEMRQKVKDYNPSQDPDRTKYFELVKDIGTRVTQSSAGEITGELYRKYGALPPKGSVRPEIQQNVSKSLDVLFDSETGAVPWRTKVPKLGSDGKPTSEMVFKDDPVAKENALNAQTVIEMKMNDWFRDNPNEANSLPAVKLQLKTLIPEGTRMGAFENMMRDYKPVNATPPNLGAQGDVGPSGPSGALDETLVDAVKEMESFIPEAYGDYKQTSVGYGTRAKSEGEVLSKEEADARLREELSMHAGRIDGAAQKAGVTLSDNQRNALISFDFNTGRGGYLIETSNGDMKEVKRRLLLYTKAGGEELKGLVNRRKREAALFDQ